MRGAVRSLARAAQSFSAIEIANVFLAAERGAAALEPRALEVLGEAAKLLSDANTSPESSAPRFLALAQQLANTTPAALSRAAASGTPPSGAALRTLLATGISGLAPLGEVHFAEPLAGEDDDVVPIDDLLFRGRDALARATEISAAFRNAGVAPDAATLGELYDLLQLAAAE